MSENTISTRGLVWLVYVLLLVATFLLFFVSARRADRLEQRIEVLERAVCK